MEMTQRIKAEGIGILGAVALLVTVLAIAPPVAAAPIHAGPIILTSTSGHYWTLGATAASSSGTAAGTMTITPVAGGAAVVNAKLTAGAISLGTTTYSITGGSAVVTPRLIRGTGTVEGGTFTFTALSMTPTSTGTPYSYNILQIQLHVGGSYYLVLLHVKTLLAP
jgi:hypothetical protein